jgi:hypothetical protein
LETVVFKPADFIGFRKPSLTYAIKAPGTISTTAGLILIDPDGVRPQRIIELPFGPLIGVVWPSFDWEVVRQLSAVAPSAVPKTGVTVRLSKCDWSLETQTFTLKLSLSSSFPS